MADGTASPQSTSFSTGRVFSRAFGTITANPIAATGIALLFAVLPSEAYSYAVRSLPRVTGSVDLAPVSETLAPVVFGWLYSALVNGAFVRLAVAHDVARQPSFVEAARAGAGALFPLIALGLITGLGTTIGMIALIVPGFWLWLLWVVAAPALVEERCGVIAALGRSSELTRGARAPILGIGLLIGGITVVWGFLQGLAGSISAGAAGHPFSSTEYNLVEAVINTIVMTVSGAVHSSIYVELRNWKHGAPKDALAEIFA